MNSQAQDGGIVATSKNIDVRNKGKKPLSMHFNAFSNQYEQHVTAAEDPQEKSIY